MKKFIFIIVAAAALFAAVPLAQAVPSRKAPVPGSARGKVLDSSDGSPAAFATVALMAADSTMAAIGTSDTEGMYFLQAPAGEYTLRVSLMGYKDWETKVNLIDGGTDIREIRLEQDAQTLAAARVSEKIPLVEMKADKIVMNVRESAFAQGNDGYDLLRKAPGVTIDKDGNVKLNGKAVSVWIDGRPSHLSGDALKGLLKCTDGSTIDKIELIANPTAKYDAAGQGGIIDIKLKKNALAGLNGTLSADGGMWHYGSCGRTALEGRISANVGWRTKKTNTTLIAGGSADHSPFRLSVDTTMPSTAGDIRSNSSTMYDSDFHSRQLKLATDWFVDDRNTVGAIVSAPMYSFDMVTTPADNVSETWMDGALVSSASDESSDISKMPMYSGNLNYTHVFNAEKSSEVTANLDWYSNGNIYSNSRNSFDSATGASLLENLVSSDNRVNIWSGKADWQGLVFGKAMMEAGAKWASSRTDNSIRTVSSVDGTSTTGLVFRENIGAAYASASAQFGKFSGKLGLRGEYTSSVGDWDPQGRQYFDLFPSVNVSWTPSEKLMMALSYSRRINRPHYSQLDPTPNYIDSKNVMAGNKDLLPEYDNDISLTSGFGQHFSVVAGYSHTDGLQTQKPTFRADGSQFLTWENKGTRDILSFSGNISYLPVTKWLSWTLSATGMLIDSKPAFNAYTCLSFVLPKDWKVEWDGFYMAGMVWGYFEILPMGSSSIAVKKGFLDGKLTLNLKFDDIFDSMNSNIRVLGIEGGGSSLIQQKSFGRRAGIGLSWNFGKAQQPTRRRNVGNLEEASRAGKSGSIGK